MTFRFAPAWRALPAVSVPFAAVIGADYLTAEEAQRIFFPEALEFSARSPGAEALGAAVRQAKTPAWPDPPQVWAAEGPDGILGHVVVDRVIGKHDFITYAVGVSSDGTVLGVEILSYREAYGGEVRNAAWRRQFIGRRGDAPLRHRVEIRNITGATLSCRHVTEGVRRVLALAASLEPEA